MKYDALLKLFGRGRIKVIVGLILLLSVESFAFNQKYRDIKVVSQQKKEFVKILLPKIERANQKIASERYFVEHFFARYIFTFNEFDKESIAHLASLKKRYKIKHLYDKKAYFLKIDTIPTSLVLAQAAVESAWGKSRFVKLAHNIFGVWTYGKDGIVPEHRDVNATHKIKIYPSLQASIEAYMLNLNRNRAYHKFRELRYRLKSEGKKFRGVDAATTMANYSGIGKKYNELLIKMIQVNHFDKYD